MTRLVLSAFQSIMPVQLIVSQILSLKWKFLKDALQPYVATGSSFGPVKSAEEQVFFPFISILCCPSESNIAIVICQFIQHLNYYPLSCWFISYSAFNNIMRKSIVSQNTANPSIFLIFAKLPAPWPIGRHQIILLGDRGTCVLTTCPGLHSIAERPGFELATCWSQVQRPNHLATVVYTLSINVL